MINTSGGTDTALTTMSTQPPPPTSCQFWMSIKTKGFFPSWTREIPMLWPGRWSHARREGLKVRKRNSCLSRGWREQRLLSFPCAWSTTPVGESRLSVTWLPARAKRMVNMVQYKQGRGNGGWQLSEVLQTASEQKQEEEEEGWGSQCGTQPSPAMFLKPACSMAKPGGTRTEHCENWYRLLWAASGYLQPLWTMHYRDISIFHVPARPASLQPVSQWSKGRKQGAL